MMQKNNIHSDHSFYRLQWACRRGMLELDVMLGDFLKNTYAALTAVERQQFAQLLTFSDPDLYAWLMGFKTPDPIVVAMIDKIRNHAYHLVAQS
ncbi:MAG: hypothetical protein ACD_45C00055G0003 [uncultured bacterium]|nr:MAG: hypothetical protein ACD_45C00055G0003 [uncultured bacterium]OGT58710.1 MAG: hypothetical protein A3F43_06790 [Gammaproteobacteria bacterium RIFCSPHIGHO2_12_FULL_42_10]